MIRKETVIAVLGSPVAYYAAFAKAMGSVDAGVFVSQFFYWHGKGHDPDGWVYKTQAEIEEETGLTRRNQETARKKLRALGVLEERYTGLPAKLFYRINIDVLFAIVTDWHASNEGGEAADGSLGEGPLVPVGREATAERGAADQPETGDLDGSVGLAMARHPSMAECAILDGGMRHAEMAECAIAGSTNAPSTDGGMRHTNTKTTTKTTAETTTITTTPPAASLATQPGVDVGVIVDVLSIPDWLLEEFEFLLGEGRRANRADRAALAEMAALPKHVILQAMDAARAWLDDETKGPIHSLARWLLGTAKRKLEAERSRGNSATTLPPEASPYVEEGYRPPTPGILRKGEDARQASGAPEDEESAFWASVLHELESRMPVDVFYRWIQPLRLLSREEDVYVIGLGNIQAKDWVENRFTHTLRMLLSSRAGHAVEVRFELMPA